MLPRDAAWANGRDVIRSNDPPGPGPSADHAGGPGLLSLMTAEPPRSRTGDPPFGAKRGSTAPATHAEPVSSPRRPAGLFEVRGVPAVTPSHAVSARDRAQPRPRPRRCDRGRR